MEHESEASDGSASWLRSHGQWPDQDSDSEEGGEVGAKESSPSISGEEGDLGGVDDKDDIPGRDHESEC